MSTLKSQNNVILCIKLGLLTVLAIIILSCNEGNYISSSRYKKEDLKKELLDTTLHNTLNEMPAIRNTATAVHVAESILFSVYGEDNIIDERPYEVQKLDNYYIINGTLPEGSKGGVFLLVIDSKNSRVVRLTHGK